ISQPEHSNIAFQWFDAKLNETIETLNSQYDDFRLSEALMTVYKLFRDDFSSWYLEIIKPEYQKPIDAVTYKQSLEFFKKLTLLIAPFMPFITEELWQFLKNNEDVESIVISKWPAIEKFDKKIISEFEDCMDVVTNIRNIRQEKNLPIREKLQLNIVKHGEYNSKFNSIIEKLGKLDKIEFIDTKLDNAASFLIKAHEYFIPLDNLIDKDEEIKKIEEELKYTQGFLNSVMKKLSNDRFVNNAPKDVIEVERKKQSDAEAKIKILNEQAAKLKS
ncbi:MAG: class I tRNA ligase family protein, partial [Bacteroidales bacterium]|nr:class I tRNA ligase family protein [Bacteroidales bacterium]